MSPRIQIPVVDISRIITAPPALLTSTGADGHYFDNSSGDVFLEVISSTTAQQLTILTGLVVDNEWSVADDLVNISNASTTYFYGKFPQNIYNQPDGSNQVWVDHSVSAVLQFRAWRVA